MAPFFMRRFLNPPGTGFYQGRTFFFRIFKMALHSFGICILEVKARVFDFGLMKIYHRKILPPLSLSRPSPIQVVHVLNALDIHCQTLEPVGQLDRHRVAVITPDLLEVRELRDFHPIAPDFPAKTPRHPTSGFPNHLRQSGYHACQGQCPETRRLSRYNS